MGAALPSGLLAALLQDAVEIDWSNPITRGLVFAAFPGKPELISDVHPLKIGGASLGSAESGRTFTAASATADGWYWPIPANHPLYSITTQDTIFVLMKRSSGAGYGNMFGVPYRSGAWNVPYYAWGLASAADSVQGAFSFATNATTRSSSVTQATNFFQNNGGMRAQGHARNGTRSRYFAGSSPFSGDAVLTGSATDAPDWSNKQPPCLFSRSNTAPGEGMAAQAAIVLVWNRELSPEEWRSIAENPGQVVRPVRRSLFTLKTIAPPANTSLAGAAAAVASAYGALATGVSLSGSAAAQATAGGALSTSIRLTGATISQASAVGALATQIRLASAAAVQSAASGALSTAIPLSGSAVAQSSASASLAGGGAVLVGTAAAQASAAGVLSTAIVLAGVATSRVSATGALAGAAAALGGAAVARAAASGVLSTSIALSGAAVAQIAVAGNLAIPAVSIDISKISPARIVIFEGSGSRVTPFESSGSRVTPFEGSGSRVTPFEGSGIRTVRF